MTPPRNGHGSLILLLPRGAVGAAVAADSSSWGRYSLARATLTSGNEPINVRTSSSLSRFCCTSMRFDYRGPHLRKTRFFFACAANCCIERTNAPVRSPWVSNDALSKNEDSRSRRFSFFNGILKIAFPARIPYGQQSKDILGLVAAQKTAF